MATEIEVAWAAGLFEGEGCFTRSTTPRPDGKPRYQLSAILSLTDHDVLLRFHAIVGVGRVYDKRVEKSHHKQQWRWVTGSVADFIAVLTILRPWLSERRIARAEELLSEYKQFVSELAAA